MKERGRLRIILEWKKIFFLAEKFENEAQCLRLYDQNTKAYANIVFKAFAYGWFVT